MTLIDDLIDGASGDTPVATLLRKVKVLASRLAVGELDQWVEHELAGYPRDADLPTYRGPYRADVLGTFAGFLGSSLQNAPIPASNFPEKYRSSLFEVEFRQSVAQLSDLARPGSDLREMWPADVIAFSNTLMRQGKVALYPDMGLQQAWKVISSAQVQSIVDNVRTRVLDLALSIERTTPEAGQEVASEPAPDAVQTFITNVYGGTSNLAIASSQVQQHIDLPRPGDRGELMAYLESIGVAPVDLGALETAIEQDDDKSGDGELGAHVSGWLGSWMVKGRRTAAAVGTGAAGEFVAAALAAYFGIG